MRSASSTSDNAAESSSGGFLSVPIEQVRVAVGGHHPALMWDLEIQQPPRGVLHHLPVGVAAHDNSYQRLIHLYRGPGTIHCASRGQCCLSGSNPSDWYSKGGAGHVVHPQAIAKSYGGRLAPVLSANPELEVRPNAAAELARHADQLTHSHLIQHLKGIILDNPVLQIIGQ